MKYVVELFDGRSLRGLLMNRQQMSELMARLEQMDPALGVVVLDITPEAQWKAGRREERNRKRALPVVDPVRTLPLDRILC